MLQDSPVLPGTHPILTVDEALAWEEALFRGDEVREWAAMEAAGRALAEAVALDALEVGALPEDGRLLVLCGPGHNGGDALLATRELLAMLPRMSALVIVAPGFARLRPLARRAAEALARAAGGRVQWESVAGPAEGRDAQRVAEMLADRSFAVCLDGLLGMRCRPPLRGPFDWLIDRVNAHRGILLRAAVDLPSGLGAGSGAAVFAADFTYATGILKEPVLGRAGAGRIRYLDLGFFDRGEPVATGGRVLTSGVLAPLGGLRAPGADKRTFGHLFVVSGSRGMPGAVLLAVEAALRSGVGLVTAFVPESIAELAAVRLPEAMWEPLPETPAGGLALEGRGAVVARAARCTALLVGPGLGRERESQALVEELLRAIDVPTVLDADALQPELALARGGPQAEAPRVFTPHAGELARLAGGGVVAGQEAALAQRLGGVLVCKGAPTRITDGSRFYLSPNGGPVLARGGSGDVVAGLIGGLLAQRGEALEAAARGVVWHGLAADRLARESGQVAVRTSDLFGHLSAVMREVIHA